LEVSGVGRVGVAVGGGADPGGTVVDVGVFAGGAVGRVGVAAGEQDELAGVVIQMVTESQAIKLRRSIIHNRISE
jgi:hypothetical protein